MDGAAEARQRVAQRLSEQAVWCRALGSPLYERLLSAAAEDVVAGGPVWAVLAEHHSDPGGSALALRFMGAVHRLVLQGRGRELAAFFPSAGGDPHERGDPWPAFRSLVEDARDELRSLVPRGVQTNEVGRAGALVGGFLLVARETGLPLRVLEAGASAGLNLRWDHYRYEARGATWGDPSSPVRLCDYNSEVPSRSRAPRRWSSGEDAIALRSIQCEKRIV
ncbi:MAG: DUF2332 domain-containing protein [Actinomycetota bacterium]|nr:DUF2332 domain-containing protein [Actinomycetota bacterium]